MEDGLTSSSSYSDSTKNQSHTDSFYRAFPYYLAIGMTYTQFWDEDCELVKYYREAAKIRQKLDNQQAWLQGAYVYEAISDIAPVLHAFAKKGTKPIPYRNEPYDLYAEAKKKNEARADNKAKAYMEAWAASINMKFQKKAGGVNGTGH